MLKLSSKTNGLGTVVAPGLVWGDYPEHAESKIDVRGFARLFDRVVPRTGAISSIDSLALEAQRLGQEYFLQTARNPELITQIPLQLRSRLVRDGLTDQHCLKALAWIGSRIRHFMGFELHQNQFICALHLLNQSLAEMATGEGKTLAAACAAAVMALAGAPVHVLTSNDYLAERDCAHLTPLFVDLGLRVACALDSQSIEERQQQYRADVVYATAKTLAFDYLRDRLKRGPRQADAAGDEHAQIPGSNACDALLLRGLCCAIIDEADGILLDEAKTPLIIADAKNDPSERGRLWQALDLARSLNENEHYRVLQAERQIRISRAGLALLNQNAQQYGGAWLNAMHRQEMVTQALTALHLLHRDVDYVVRDDEIVIVDPTTGRTAEGRQWSMGLHALVALKEKLPLPVGSRTLASLTFPRLFSRYHHLSGLSGTLAEDSAELLRTYGLRVKAVPRHQPLQRIRYPVRCFYERSTQFEAAKLRVLALADAGRPVLLATDSVEDSNALAQVFLAAGHPVTVLNATHTANEAQTISLAGEHGRITLATQVAGRGTDIRLGAGVHEIGGLHVLSLQLNRSARIDRQIEGRCARQGDAGSSEHWIRIEDSALAQKSAAGLIRPILKLLVPLAQTRLPDAARAVPWYRRICARAILASYQRYCRSEDAVLRHQVLKADQDWSNRLHFAAVVE